MRALPVVGPLVLGLWAACSDAPAGPRAPQHEVTAVGELLTTDGTLREPGWSQHMLQHWDPSRVHDKTALRQWDFFTVLDETAACNLTLLDLGFAQIATVGVVDFADSTAHQTSVFAAPGDTFQLSAAVDGDAQLKPALAAAPALAFSTAAGQSRVDIAVPQSLLGDAGMGTLTLTRPDARPYLSVATPFDSDSHQFFYEQKIPGLAANGTVTIGARSWTFDPATAYAVMDWGRGQWPSTAMWHWAGASGTVGGAPFSFNLGDGFGNARAATENLVVAGEVANKLAEVDWTHDANDPMKDWTFAARDGRLKLTLHPIAHETGGLDLGVRYTHLQKAYGHYSGTITLDDGTIVTLDGLLGFAEEEHLSW